MALSAACILRIRPLYDGHSTELLELTLLARPDGNLGLHFCLPRMSGTPEMDEMDHEKRLR